LEPDPYVAARAALQENLAARRYRLRLSQRALGVHSGVNVAYITQIETGSRNPSLLILGRLAAALGTDIVGLLKERRAAGPVRRYSGKGAKRG